MSVNDIEAPGSGDPRNVEVRVYLDGRLVERVRCESQDEAEALMRERAEEGSFEFEVADAFATADDVEAAADTSVPEMRGDDDG